VLTLNHDARNHELKKMLFHIVFVASHMISLLGCMQYFYGVICGA